MGVRFRAQKRARAVRRPLDLAGARICTTSGRTWKRRRSGATRRRRTSSSRVDAALEQYHAPQAGSLRGYARYAANCETLIAGMTEMGFRPFLDSRIQAPIIVTFHAPADPRYAFKAVLRRGARQAGFILYPGKLTQLETFRVGCIGAIGPDEMRHAVNAVRDTPGGSGHPPASRRPPSSAA